MKIQLGTYGVLAGFLLLWSASSTADDFDFRTLAAGEQEVVFDSNGNFVPGGVDTDGDARLVARFDRALTRVRVNLRVDDLTGTFAAAHFHCARAGANGPIPFGLVNPGPLQFDGRRIRGVLTNENFNGADCEPLIGRPVSNIAALFLAMRDGLIYVNVHSDIFPAGELRGQVFDDGRSNKDKRRHN